MRRPASACAAWWQPWLDFSPSHAIERAVNGFLFALIAAGLTGIGARDQLLLARISARHGPQTGLLAVAALTGALAAAIAARVGGDAAPQLPARARLLLAAFALVVAAGEMVLIRRPRPLREPTHSLGATAIVLLAHQITDASRLLVFAIAVSWPWPQVALGGALGGMLALAGGWLGGADFLAAERWLRRARIGAGLVLALAAAALAFAALGDVDRFLQSLRAFISARPI